MIRLIWRTKNNHCPCKVQSANQFMMPNQMRFDEILDILDSQWVKGNFSRSPTPQMSSLSPSFSSSSSASSLCKKEKEYLVMVLQTRITTKRFISWYCWKEAKAAFNEETEGCCSPFRRNNIIRYTWTLLKSMC